MLETALRARLPLITCTTRDPLAISAVLKELTGKKSVTRANVVVPSLPSPGATVYAIGNYKFGPAKGTSAMTTEKAESMFLQKEVSFILVNPAPGFAVPPNFYDAGEMPTPLALVERMLVSILGMDCDIPTLIPALGGLTLKEVNWLTRLASAQSGEVTCESLTNARKTAFPARQGLEQVDTAMDLYLPSARLEAWMSMELPFLLGKHTELRPRGILLAGPPGTGKTMAAKRIAEELKIPLYRFDLAGVMNKYVGETEKAIAQALAQADREAPCVFLIDEVEKVFAGTGGSGDHGLTSKILASLLWWLQEHTSPVLTVLTTNDIKVLPRELYRPGRIDDVLHLMGVTFAPAFKLAGMIRDKYPDVKITETDLAEALEGLWGEDPHLHTTPQAEIVGAITKLVKARILEDNPNGELQ